MAMPSRPLSQGGFQIFPRENEGYRQEGITATAPYTLGSKLSGTFTL